VGGLSGANVAATARARPARRRGRQPRRGGRGAVGEAARHLPAARWRPATPLRAHTGAARAGGGDAHSFCNTSSHSTTRRAPTHTSCSAFALARARRRGRFSERGGSGGRAAGEAAEAARPAVDQPPAGVPRSGWRAACAARRCAHATRLCARRALRWTRRPARTRRLWRARRRARRRRRRARGRSDRRGRRRVAQRRRSCPLDGPFRRPKPRWASVVHKDGAIGSRTTAPSRRGLRAE
jgi:hypothetical protein